MTNLQMVGVPTHALRERDSRSSGPAALAG
jgi:hypothetical protein